MLNGLDFRDKFADISCDTLQETLYNQNNHYELVIFSQEWAAYEADLLNAPEGLPKGSLERWAPFIKSTIEHFSKNAEQIIILGQHITVNGSSLPKPSLFLTKEQYRNMTHELRVTNEQSLHDARSFFDKWTQHERVTVVHPEDIWIDTHGNFKLRDEQWSFFRDSIHISKASLPFLVDRLRNHPDLTSIARKQKLAEDASLFNAKPSLRPPG
jgi:hypothetical protein